MTPEQIEEWERRIDAMDQMEMARLLRFAPAGHPVFRRDLPLYERFEARFAALGGMTPGISHALGW